MQPGHPGELDRVGDLVEGHPGHELLVLGPEGADRLAEVGQYEQQTRGPLGHRLVEQHELVLAEHALGHIAEHDAHLGADDQPHADLHGRAQRPESLG